MTRVRNYIHTYRHTTTPAHILSFPPPRVSLVLATLSPSQVLPTPVMLPLPQAATRARLDCASNTARQQVGPLPDSPLRTRASQKVGPLPDRPMHKRVRLLVGPLPDTPMRKRPRAKQEKLKSQLLQLWPITNINL